LYILTLAQATPLSSRFGRQIMTVLPPRVRSRLEYRSLVWPPAWFEGGVLLLRWLGPSVSKKRGVCRSEATAKLGLAGSDPTGLFGNPQVKPPRMFRAGGFTWGLLSSGGVGPRQRSRRARRARTAPVLLLGRCAKNLRGVSRDRLASRHPARRSLAWSGVASGRCAPPGPAGPLAAKGAPPSGWTCEYGR